MKSPLYGYLESPTTIGFKAVDRKLFIERLKICKNWAQICRSIPVDRQAVLDAVAVDEKFRADVNAAEALPNRAIQLNEGLVTSKHAEQQAILDDLKERAKKYT